MIEYKGFTIEEFFGYLTVQYCGDDVVFDTVDEAKNFIDGIAK